MTTQYTYHHSDSTPAASSLDDLRAQIETILAPIDRTVGYSLHHLKRNERLERLGDEMFPTDCSIKVPILYVAMEKVERGEIGYHELRPLPEEDRDHGSGFFKNYRAGSEIEFREALHQMVAVSDNTACLMITRWIGGVEVVNNWLGNHGLKTTRLLFPHPLSEEIIRDETALRKLLEPFNKWGMGVSTPNEMLTLMEMVVDGRAGTPAACDEMHRLFNHQYYDQNIASQIPPCIVVASKSGFSLHSRSDTAIIHSPSGIYALSIFIQGGTPDPYKGPQNVDFQVMHGISRAVWRYYHPNDKWMPPPGIDKYVY
jgi:beta-lactamase class A